MVLLNIYMYMIEVIAELYAITSGFPYIDHIKIFPV